MIRPQPRTRTEYKQPSRFNLVSVLLLLACGALGYLAFCVWPVLALRAEAMDALNTTLPQVFRVINRAPNTVAPEVARLKKMLIDDLEKRGIKDKKLLVTITYNKKLISADAHFTLTAYFPWLEKKQDFPINLHVETDAERIEW